MNTSGHHRLLRLSPAPVRALVLSEGGSPSREALRVTTDFRLRGRKRAATSNPRVVMALAKVGRRVEHLER